MNQMGVQPPPPGTPADHPPGTPGQPPYYPPQQPGRPQQGRPQGYQPPVPPQQVPYQPPVLPGQQPPPQQPIAQPPAYQRPEDLGEPQAPRKRRRQTPPPPPLPPMISQPKAPEQQPDASDAATEYLPQIDPNQIDPTRTGPTPQQPSHTEPQYEEPQFHEPQYQEPQYEQPRYEEPQYDEPHRGEPRFEEPQYEQPPVPDSSQAWSEVTPETPGYEPPLGGSSYEPPAYEPPDEPAVDAEPSTPSAPTRRRPLEPTPDLTGAFETVTARRKATRKSDAAKKTSSGSKASAGKKKSAPKDNRPGGRALAGTGRVLVALACVLTLVGTGFVWSMQRGWNDSWNFVQALNPNDQNIRNKGAQTGDENYLIVGTDSRAGKNSKLGGGDEYSIEGVRADTILLVNVPADRSRVVAVSWPRDLQVDRPECESWDPKTGDYDPNDMVYAQDGVKLNSVYAVGGPKCLVSTLQQISGLDINRFIAMDFEGFEKVVNAIGGVQVCSTVPLYDYELGYVLRKKGTTKLKGRRALNYVRARNISAEGNGDYGRIKRQQLFMSSLLRSTLSGDVLRNPGKMNKIVNTFIEYSNVDNIKTDDLIQLAQSMQGMDAGAVTFVTVPTAGTSEDGENNEIMRTDDVDAIFDAIIEDKPLPGEKSTKSGDGGNQGGGDQGGDTPAPAPKTETPSQVDATAQYPSNTTVRVLNGSGKSGVASEVMNQLIANYFTVPGVADASTQRDDTVVRYGPGEQDSAATVAEMFPGARIQEDKNVKVGVEVILGKDFNGLDDMQSPPEPGSTITVGQLPKADTKSDLPNDLAVTNAGDTTCS